MAEETESESLTRIVEDAAGPKRVRGDNGNEVEVHSLADQLELLRYRRSQSAASRGLGVRLIKLIPPGQE